MPIKKRMERSSECEIEWERMKPCPYCKCYFEKSRSDQVYCCKECKRLMYNFRRRKQPFPQPHPNCRCIVRTDWEMVEDYLQELSTEIIVDPGASNSKEVKSGSSRPYVYLTFLVINMFLIGFIVRGISGL